MSYCRVGWDGEDVSDVYVIATVASGGEMVECVGCLISSSYFETADRQVMIVHLLAHRAVGHAVPQYAIDRLEAERDGRPYKTFVEQALEEET